LRFEKTTRKGGFFNLHLFTSIFANLLTFVRP
jgi:hypothetical protein